jgi:3-dehydroquinate synthase
MLGARLERRSPVVALGGGVVGDTAGFAAATYLRGVPLVQAPTTLLAMVDAAIGGKTGVNIEIPPSEHAPCVLGKNLIGAFWQPRAVVCDPLVLRTLPQRDLRCGLAECVKHALIADPGLLTLLAESCGEIESCDEEALTPLIARSAAVKINIVQEDEREAGSRALLNLGHTFAHAIEPIPELDLRHGEAVSIGVCAAVRCAVLTGRMEETEGDIVVDLLELLGLPVEMPQPVEIDRLLHAMSYDKKAAGGRVRLVLPTGLGSAAIVDDAPAEAVIEAWESVGAMRGGNAGAAA